MYLNTKSLKKRFVGYFFLQGKKIKIENFFQHGVKSVQKIYYKNHFLLFKLLILKTLPIVSIMRIKRKKKILKEIPFVISRNARILKSVNALKIIGRKSTLISFNKNPANLLISMCKTQNLDVSGYKEIHEQAFSIKKYSNFRWF